MPEKGGAVWPPAGHLYTTAMKTAFRARYANGVELICRTQDPAAEKFVDDDEANRMLRRPYRGPWPGVRHWES